MSDLSDPMDCSPPGTSVHGIFQARVLEWGAIALSELRQRTHVIRTPVLAKNYWMLTVCQACVEHFKYFNLLNVHGGGGHYY